MPIKTQKKIEETGTDYNGITIENKESKIVTGDSDKFKNDGGEQQITVS